MEAVKESQTGTLLSIKAVQWNASPTTRAIISSHSHLRYGESIKSHAAYPPMVRAVAPKSRADRRGSVSVCTPSSEAILGRDKIVGRTGVCVWALTSQVCEG